MSQPLPFRYSERAQKTDKALPFGVLIAQNLSMTTLQGITNDYKADALNLIHQDQGRIEGNVKTFNRFFEQEGFKCPLPSQLQATLKKGFPKISAAVDALLICEMTNGILMGVQDLDQVSGELVYDVLSSDESFEGMRNKITCRANEIVLRDNLGIIASYFQGPDKRTSVRPETRSLIFFVFGAPDLLISSLDAGLLSIAELLEPASEKLDFAILQVPGGATQ